MFTDATAGAVQGKLDQFPLADESTRAMSPADNLSDERRLLLDPCADEPEQHLAFGVDGSPIAISESPQANASIDVYHLKRRRLKTARKKVVNSVIAFLKQAQELRQAGLTAPADKLVASIRKHLAADDCPYSGVARSILRDPAAFGL